MSRPTTVTCCKCSTITFYPDQEKGWPVGWISFADETGRWMCPDCRVPAEERTYTKQKGMSHYR